MLYRKHKTVWTIKYTEFKVYRCCELYNLKQPCKVSHILYIFQFFWSVVFISGPEKGVWALWVHLAELNSSWARWLLFWVNLTSNDGSVSSPPELSEDQGPWPLWTPADKLQTIWTTVLAFIAHSWDEFDFSWELLTYNVWLLILFLKKLMWSVFCHPLLRRRRHRYGAAPHCHNLDLVDISQLFYTQSHIWKSIPGVTLVQNYFKPLEAASSLNPRCWFHSYTHRSIVLVNIVDVLLISVTDKNIGGQNKG